MKFYHFKFIFYFELDKIQKINQRTLSESEQNEKLFENECLLNAYL